MDKVVHFEIPYDNKARAFKFYTEIFGWKLMARTSWDCKVQIAKCKMDKTRCASIVSASRMNQNKLTMEKET